MGRENAAWFVMGLMLLLSGLMTFHLLTLWVGVELCRDYGKSVIDPTVALTGVESVTQRCAGLEATMSEAVDKYLSVILSLIGGAAVSGGVATAVHPASKRDDEP